MDFLIQSIAYNENNDAVFIDGEKGDVAFQYGLTSMRQRVSYGGNFRTDEEGKFTKFYSEDGSFEVIKDNTTGREKHILYIGGNPYDSNIVYLKDYTQSSGSFRFLHKDYIGSILAISDEAGNKLEQRHFDAWGNFTHLKIGNTATLTGNALNQQLSTLNLLIDRGYTSHEHFAEVGIIHMNGRLYDPLLRRFLNADENIQDPDNTQIYNKYGYALNNPLMYNDPSGEVLPFLIGVGLGYFWASVISGAIVGTLISIGVYTLQAAYYNNWSLGGFAKSILMGAVTGAVSAGAGQIFSAGGFWATVGNGTLAGAGSGGVVSLINGTNFLQGVLKGAIIGGAVAGVSYTMNYLFTSGNENRITEKDLGTDSSTNSETSSSELPYNDKTLHEIRQNNFGPRGMKEWAVNSDTTNSDLYQMNTNGEFYQGSTENSFVAYTDAKANFWNGRSTIHYSKSVFTSPERILKTMNHESVHAFGNSPAGMTFRLARKTEIQGIDLEHLAVRKAEWSFLNANDLSSKGMNVLNKETIDVLYRQLNSSQKNIFNIMFKYINPMFSKKIIK